MSKLVGFKHPIQDVYIMASYMHMERQRICTTMHGILPCEQCVWNFQSFPELANNIFNIKFDTYLPPSVFIKELEDTPALAYADTLCEVRKQIHGFDIVKCYSSQLMNSECDFPVFCAFDAIEVYTGGNIKVGEYRIKCDFKMGRGYMSYTKGWYNYETVRHCLDIGSITLDDIDMQLISSRTTIPHNHFKEFVAFNL